MSQAIAVWGRRPSGMMPIAATLIDTTVIAAAIDRIVLRSPARGKAIGVRGRAVLTRSGGRA